MTEAGLKLDDVTISLGPTRLLAIAHHVAPGETLTVMGPSGSGKSSLLAFVGGFLDPAFRAGGRVVCDGVDILALPPERRHAGILFQDPLLFPHMSVAGNLLFALPQAVSGKAARRAAVEDALREHEARQDFGAHFVALARSVYRHNDHRAAIKKRINLALGSRIVEEKSW